MYGSWGKSCQRGKESAARRGKSKQRRRIGLHCINCGHKQSEGKFCATCGIALGTEVIEAQQTMSRTATNSDIKSNETIALVKVVTKAYWVYFINYLKRPSDALEQGEKEFVNGIVTIVIQAILIGLSMFTLLNGVPIFLYGFPYAASFVDVVGKSLLFGFGSTAISIGSLFITINYLGPYQSLKNIAGIYGTLLIPSTFLILIALISLLLQAYAVGNLLLSFALLIAFLFVPLYILIKILSKELTAVDPLYCVAVYVVIVGIAFSILFILLGDYATGSMMSRLVLF